MIKTGLLKKDQKLLIRVFSKRITDLHGYIAHLEKFSHRENKEREAMTQKHKDEIKELEALQKKLLNWWDS